MNLESWLLYTGKVGLGLKVMRQCPLENSWQNNVMAHAALQNKHSIQKNVLSLTTSHNFLCPWSIIHWHTCCSSQSELSSCPCSMSMSGMKPGDDEPRGRSHCKARTEWTVIAELLMQCVLWGGISSLLKLLGLLLRVHYSQGPKSARGTGIRHSCTQVDRNYFPPTWCSLSVE